MKKIVISWVFSILGLVALLAWLSHGMLSRVRNAPDPSGSSLVHAEFTLQSANGKTVSAADLRGQYLLVYFGFTHCPDICPTSLLLMTNVLGQLGELGEKVTPIFISVDPERDTPDVAAQYASHFGPRVLGLSGTPEAIRHAADSFKVYYSKVEDKSSALGYVVDHSGFIYLMGPKGEYLAHFTHTTSEQELKQGLMEYVH